MPCRRGPHSAASLLSYEVPELPCIEVRVFWGNTLLRVDHLAPPRSYHVGEPSADTKVDFVVPKEKLGARGLQLIRSNGASPSVVIPAVACARVEQVGLRPVTLEKRVGRRDVGSGGGRKGKPCAAPPSDRAAAMCGSNRVGPLRRSCHRCVWGLGAKANSALDSRCGALETVWLFRSSSGAAWQLDAGDVPVRAAQGSLSDRARRR